jgi:hypothetical protein
MFQVKFLDANRVPQFVSFASHAEASRFVRGCIASRIKAELVTKLEVARGNLGGYGGVNALRPVHCLGR